jgi:type II secretory pathway component PulK
MGVATAAVVVASALTAGAAQKQHVTARRAETRAKSIAAVEGARQAEVKKRQEAEIAEQTEKQQDIFRSRRARQAGRRSLLFGGELGTQSTLG